MQEFFVIFFLNFYQFVIFTSIVCISYVNHNMLTLLLFYTLCQDPEFRKNRQYQINPAGTLLVFYRFFLYFHAFYILNTILFEKSFIEIVNITAQQEEFCYIYFFHFPPSPRHRAAAVL